MKAAYVRVLLGAALGAAALAIVHVVLLSTYWNSEEGTYALTARLIISGHDLYRQTVAAQPPGVFLAGAGLLAIHDSLEWLRLGVAGFQLTAGLLAAQIVWRTTGSFAASVITPAATLLTPWAVQEHGALTPELISLPFLLGALLACRRERTLPVAGMLCGLLPLIKVPDLLPAIVIVLCSVDARRAGAWAIGTLVLGVAATFALAGDAFWREAFVAQSQAKLRSVAIVKGWWLQAGWTLGGLVVCCVCAFGLRARSLDWPQLRAVLLTGVAMLVTLLTVLKDGTGLNVTVPVEAVLVPAAVTGVVLAWRAAARSRASGGGQAAPRWVAVLTVVAAALTLAQTVSLLASPKDPAPFERIGSARVGWAEGMSRTQFDAAVRAARACPAGSVYGGQTLIAFAAGRQVPDDQPDGFITAAPALHAVQERIASVRDICG
ncbi:MAG: hypothetical protein WAK93_13520 [Solirubrobacteraceae bacterium]